MAICVLCLDANAGVLKLSCLPSSGNSNSACHASWEFVCTIAFRSVLEVQLENLAGTEMAHVSEILDPNNVKGLVSVTITNSNGFERFCVNTAKFRRLPTGVLSDDGIGSNCASAPLSNSVEYVEIATSRISELDYGEACVLGRWNVKEVVGNTVVRNRLDGRIVGVSSGNSTVIDERELSSYSKDVKNLERGYLLKVVLRKFQESGSVTPANRPPSNQ